MQVLCFFTIFQAGGGEIEHANEKCGWGVQKRGEVGGAAKESHPSPLLLIFSHLLAVSISHVLLQIMNADYASQQAIVHPKKSIMPNVKVMFCLKD